MRNKIISVVLCLGVILALTLVSGSPPPKVALAQGNDWGFEIQPNMTKVGFTEDFTVDAVVTHYSGDSDTWQMMLRFDPALLEVTSVVRPTTLPNGQSPDPYPGEPTWNNTEGWVYDGYGTPPLTPHINQTFVFGTIHFSSKSASGTSPLNFTYEGAYYSTQVILVGSDYLNWTRVVNGTVWVGTPTLTVNVTPTGTGTVKANGVTLTGYPNTTNRSWDVNVTLLAVNSTPGWGFVNWTGDVADPNAISTTVTMDAFTKNVTANFKALPAVHLTISSTAGGNVTIPGEGSFGPYAHGTVVNLKATADANYHFVNWTGDTGTIGNVNAASTTITMNGDYEIVANFEKTAAPPPPAGVGGTPYLPNKLAILAPWIALVAAIIAGATIFLRRRRAQG